MYTPRKIIDGLQNTRKLGREMNKFIHTRGGNHEYNRHGVDVFDEDWDTLIILDACRYDIFSEVSNLPGNLEYRYSKGSATYNFIRANFAERRAHDTVYVSANSWFLKLKNEINTEIHDFIDLQYGDQNVEWVNEELMVVTPETVTEAAIKATENYPQKRLIVHYIQPHHPFIGPTGRDQFLQQSSSLVDVVDQNNCSDALLRQAYEENLILVLEDVKKLLQSVSGRTIVTSDHGEMLGDRHDYVPTRDYGHHKGIFNDTTLKVPWLIYQNGKRKEVTSDPPARIDAIDTDTVNEQLRNLGYKVE